MAIDAVQRMFHAIETGELDDAEDYIAADYENREALDDGRSQARGPSEFRETAAWMRGMFSDLRFETADTIACGNRVVVVVYMHGRQTATFFGIPPTGRAFRQRQVHLFRLNPEGKVTEHLAQRDDLGLRLQLMK
jgi:predicted ester cyclase